MVVLNEATGAVMSSRWFDTYESKADSGILMDYLKGLRQGRIVCFAIKVFVIIYSFQRFLGFSSATFRCSFVSVIEATDTYSC